MDRSDILKAVTQSALQTLEITCNSATCAKGSILRLSWIKTCSHSCREVELGSLSAPAQ